MNQILFNKNANIKKENTNKKNILVRKDLIKKYKLILILSLIILLLSLSYYLFNILTSIKNENISYDILNSYNLNRLYSSNNSHTNIFLNNDVKSMVIGNIEIPKLNINYPILSNTNDELLKISPCRFYGPYPNETGNLCIAGHNYDDDRFFGNLSKLNITDTIKIYDSNNNSIDYYIYDKYEINDNDTSCTSQNTNSIKEITLVTCNNINGNRLVVKAKEK